MTAYSIKVIFQSIFLSANSVHVPSLVKLSNDWHVTLWPQGHNELITINEFSQIRWWLQGESFPLTMIAVISHYLFTCQKGNHTKWSISGPKQKIYIDLRNAEITFWLFLFRKILHKLVVKPTLVTEACRTLYSLRQAKTFFVLIFFFNE